MGFSLSSAFSGIGSSALGLLGNLAGAGLSAYGAKQANALSVAEAQKQRDWLERMSSTAHQREVADLRAAGLNPILSANGTGANVGGAATASIINPFQGAGEMVSSAAQSFGAVAQSRAAFQQAKTAEKLSNSQIDLNRSQTGYTDAQTDFSRSATELNHRQLDAVGEQIKTMISQQHANSAAAVHSLAGARASDALASLHAAAIGTEMWKRDLAQAQAIAQQQANELKAYDLRYKAQQAGRAKHRIGDVQSQIGTWTESLGRFF